VSDAAPARRWPRLRKAATVAVYLAGIGFVIVQGCWVRYRDAERTRDLLEIKVQLEELAERPCNR
jgi:hypothetical protein